jgi:putative flippase GtrA
MIKVFARYLSVGVVNTLLHWGVFLLLHLFWGVSQVWSNVSAFAVAVTFSFFANAAYTFQARATSLRYVLFTVFMGALSIGVGAAADRLSLPPLVTLVVFSALSLVVGFVYSKWIVFRSAT